MTLIFRSHWEEWYKKKKKIVEAGEMESPFLLGKHQRPICWEVIKILKGVVFLGKH